MPKRLRRDLKTNEALTAEATRKNWERLNVADGESKLTKRANKTNSKKRFIPAEYFSDKSNLLAVENIVHEITTGGYKLSDAMYTVVLSLFKKRGFKLKSGRKNVKAFLYEYSACKVIPQLTRFELPENEADLPGLIYQSLYAEGDKNKRGLYYTPADTAGRLTAGLDFSRGQCLFDPCCGSGSFLMNAPVAAPEQLCGIDCDPIAVMLCKANLIMRFKEHAFTPRIYSADFLTEVGLPPEIKEEKFDYICANPPWGARASRKNGGESFARFLYKAPRLLKSGGILVFLLPEAVLNVKTHSRLRAYLLDNYSLRRMELFPKLFTEVTTKAVAITVENAKRENDIEVIDGERVFKTEPDLYKKTINCVFSLIDAKDKEILDKLYAKGRFDLSGSVWALGIVTGDNNGKLLKIPSEASEPIYTGKEIQAYRLSPPKRYIVYIRSEFQQVAEDGIYRAKEKLVYKFISKRLVFAYDASGSLFLNSANILIPAVPFMSAQSALLLLNSELFRFAYIKIFGEIKALKGNLCELPFPQLLIEEDRQMRSVAERIIGGDDSALSAAREIVRAYYGLTEKQADYIRGVLF